MQKNFDEWNSVKKKAHSLDEYMPLYHERQIRWCRIGANIGFEQDGTGKGFSRPVLVLKAFNRNVCIVIPLTTSTKKNPYHRSVGRVDGREAFAIISQIRLIDTKRLDQHMMTLGKDVFETIRKSVKDML